MSLLHCQSEWFGLSSLFILRWCTPLQYRSGYIGVMEYE